MNASRKSDATISDVMVQRDPFDRDWGRVLHSSSFRRLAGKTQVWGVLESDYFRTRMTHSLEAAQIGAAIAKEYNFAPFLIMAACLAHDIGHPPFGHDGADALKQFAMEVTGGDVVFDDNAQTFRTLVRRESMFGSSSGMNLTAATLDATLKYKVLASRDTKKAGYYDDDKETFDWVVSATGTSLKRSPLVMFVELADDIAYACHDLDDAMRARFVTLDDLRHAHKMCESPAGKGVLQFVIDSLEKVHGVDDAEDEPFRIKIKRVKSALVDRFVTAAVKHKDAIKQQMHHLQYGDELKTNLFFTAIPGLEEEIEALKGVVRRYVIEDPNVESIRFAGTSMLKEYLGRYRELVEAPKVSSPAWLSLPRVVRQRLADAGSTRGRVRILLDYIAGMTDRYFIEQATLFHDLGRGRALTMRR